MEEVAEVIVVDGLLAEIFPAVFWGGGGGADGGVEEAAGLWIDGQVDGDDWRASEK